MPESLYPFEFIESKWQSYWKKNKTFKATEDPAKKKFYVLDMFPYPSGSGLHVGHPEGYTATDIYSRFKRMQGFNVLHPMGWDAFGLPAEQYAIETGTHPAVTTRKNIQTFKRQIQTLGLSYDWDREVDTTDPEYVRWTQWIFLKLFNSFYDPDLKTARSVEFLQDVFSDNPKHKDEWKNSKKLMEWRELLERHLSKPQFQDLQERIKERNRIIDEQYRLAYMAEIPVWWCEALGCVLANEEVVDGKSERGGHPVERRPMKQWMLRITAYADRLSSDLKLVSWPESIKEMQRNWIGRSEGASVYFKVANHPSPMGTKDNDIVVFTTRPDTLFGATYVVLAPDHPLVARITTPAQKAAVENYRQKTIVKSDLERTELTKEKTGVFTGADAINPVNDQKIPIWIADYVLWGYGTGAIMAVPAHDERDYEFAKKFGLKIVEVIKGGNISKEAFTDDGVNVNSGFLDNLPTSKAKEKIISWLQEKNLGESKVGYKLRDWLFSRQRYWGEPIPIIHCVSCGLVPLSENDLPLELPKMFDFKPSGNAEPPLIRASSKWLTPKCPKCGGSHAYREANTMPQWAGSCWYYLRYLDPKNNKVFCDPTKEKHWMPVDLYVGGAEHAVLHLLYSRFWHKVLYDLKFVSTPEPFMKLVNQGMILGEDGQKMSKSRGNVINPDFVVENYGADSMRLYEMFMGPLTQMKAWSMKGVEGVYRFLGRVWRAFTDKDGNLSPSIADTPMRPELETLLHQTIAKVSSDIENLQFNTAISSLMVFLNEVSKEEKKPRAALEPFLLLLSPFAPHLAEELWQKLGYKNSLAYEAWPKFNPAFLVEKTLEIPIMVNGKVKSRITIAAELDEAAVEREVMKDPKVLSAVEGKNISQKKYIPKKIFTIAAS